MSSTLGKNIEVSIYGESHGVGVGVVLNGLPSGFKVDLDLINQYLYRRSTGRDNTMSARKELDKVEILSGVYNGYTTGTPLSMLIYNTDQRSKDYDKMQTLARPSHADYTGYVRYKGFNDIRGGGHFSGRLTTPLVMAGAVCMSILNQLGIDIVASIKSIGEIECKSIFSDIENLDFISFKNKDFPSVDKCEDIKEYINEKRLAQDSVGGYIECAIKGLKAGVGSPMFYGVENVISNAIFGIPAIKGIEFGEDCELVGSIYNDNIYVENNSIKTKTNHDGGINGGITNGMPILFKVKVKPTPSIMRVQETINYKTLENSEIQIVGRHDPCVVVRAVPCVECVTAIAILDLVMEGKKYE